MSLDNLKQFYKSHKESVHQQVSEDGHATHGDEAIQERTKHILEVMSRKDSYKNDLNNKDIEKATYPAPDYAAIATKLCQTTHGHDDYSPGSAGAKCRDTLAAAMEADKGPGGAGPANWVEDEGKQASSKVKKSEDGKPLKKLSPYMERLGAAIAGWLVSDDVVRAGGGSPRGNMSDQQAREWERTLSAAERRQLERQGRNRMRKRASDKNNAYTDMQIHFEDGSDEYVRKAPLKNGINLNKEHSAAPPRQGLMWDAVKHRWTRPENIGHTVTEVQGKKRVRGQGTGVHERSVGGHGGGSTRRMESGRRFRGATDAGTARPHESKAVGRLARRTRTHK
tara:strand:+ start:794 stop:1807 length:1014 start_codon:yes stop_codon:yes gene_type:complete